MSLLRGRKRSPSPAQHERRKITRCQASPVTINFKYISKEFTAMLKQCYQDKLPLKHESGAIYETEPFPLFVLPKFINEKEFLRRLKEELLELKFNEKRNDLYSFQQSDDLGGIDIRHIKYLRKLLYGEFRKILTEVTGIDLSNKVDMTCAQYCQGDVLLCHDDELEERRIAYILYLVPVWKSEDGGTLDLFDCDNKGQPGTIVKSFVPMWNSLIFFEVSERSFHQVSEVLSPDKTRLTISGWFHGPPLKRSVTTPLIFHNLITPQEIDEKCLRSWINPDYLKSETQTEIQEKFQTESEIELHDFLIEDKFAEVEKALLTNDLCWTTKGPANRHSYELADTETLPPVVRECIKVFSSEAMFLILSNLTGLALHSLAATAQKELEDAGASTSNKEIVTEPESTKITAKCRYQVRQWKHGSYTLIHDEDNENMECALDAMLFFNCKNWKPYYGGFTSYIARDEDEELLSIYPSRNSLALVYRDKETLRFVKYINVMMKEAPLNCFQDLFFVYYE